MRPQCRDMIYGCLYLAACGEFAWQWHLVVLVPQPRELRLSQVLREVLEAHGLVQLDVTGGR